MLPNTRHQKHIAWRAVENHTAKVMLFSETASKITHQYDEELRVTSYELQAGYEWLRDIVEHYKPQI